jgi:hypothetical protein
MAISIAETSECMSACTAATLYAAKVIQRASTIGKVRGNFKVTWVKLGRSNHKALFKASRGLKFADLFDAGVYARSSLLKRCVLVRCAASRALLQSIRLRVTPRPAARHHVKFA